MFGRYSAWLRVLCLATCIVLPACQTVKPVELPPADQPLVETPELEAAPIAEPEPEPDVQLPPVVSDPEPSPEPIIVLPPDVPATQRHPGFEQLSFWDQSDPSPALNSFRETCRVWEKRKDEDWLQPSLVQYGKYKDWRDTCAAANIETGSAWTFFETYFTPIKLNVSGKTDGLLTGYYAPEIEARRHASAEFSEPVLARPKRASVQSLPRRDLNAQSSKVLAYGRPIDVFFLQIQGSGRLKFEDGTSYRAAFNGHNSHKYVSIGKLLIERGEMTKDQASKQAIEAWMRKAGPVKARALMNDNPRYIFFKTESIIAGKGPKGSLGAPLTAMGSLAVDKRYHPAGSLVWLSTKLPVSGGDFNGSETGLLVSVQDTGSAIKGALRGDLYFGAGGDAGEKAGVMKHRASWTIFIPKALAAKKPPVS